MCERSVFSGTRDLSQRVTDATLCTTMQRATTTCNARYVWTYMFALPLGQYPLGIPPDRGHTYRHRTCKRNTLRLMRKGLYKSSALKTYNKRAKNAVGPKPKMVLAPTACKSSSTLHVTLFETSGPGGGQRGQPPGETSGVGRCGGVHEHRKMLRQRHTQGIVPYGLQTAAQNVYARCK